jgi:hypothetical protein
MNGIEQRHPLEAFIDKSDPHILNLWMTWDKGDCSIVGLLEILLHQEIKKHKKENGEYYDRDYDKIILRCRESIPVKLTHETIQDLDKAYSIDAEEEIIRLLNEELKPHFTINPNSLKEYGWVEWDNPYTGKKTWAKNKSEDDEFSELPGYLFEYDLETNTFRYNGGEFSTIIKEGFTGNIVELNLITTMLLLK